MADDKKNIPEAAPPAEAPASTVENAALPEQPAPEPALTDAEVVMLEHEEQAALFEMGEAVPDPADAVTHTEVEDSAAPEIPKAEKEQAQQPAPGKDDPAPAHSGKVVDFSAARDEAAKEEKKAVKQKPLTEKDKTTKPGRGRPPKEGKAAPDKAKPPKPRDKKSQSKPAPEKPAVDKGGAPAGTEVTPEPSAPRDATRAEKEEIVYLNLSDLHPFKNHPFGVRDDAEMQGLVESVKAAGVNQPALVRPREDGGYEIIAGHRRQRASELAGFANMPCIVRNMTDDEAILAMTDDNLRHRAAVRSVHKMSEFIGTKLTMNLGERSYDIILKSGALENLYQFARLDRRVAIVTDSGVPAQYAQRVADQCKDAKIITVPQGEASKSFKILETVLRQMLEFNMGRGDLVIAVGGGVVGDLAGFAASIYMRGIDFINCPTTTLSMIDSSIGGKTAVDLGDTKNIVGAFWQPKLVIVDPETLSTLPRRHYINGLAEAVKASLLADPELFAIFEKGDVDARIGEIIYRSLRFKKNIVEQDEQEHGMRKALNFGHTIGHGIEAVKGIKGRRTVGLFHGECVALGMLPMIESKALQKRVRAVYRRLGLPLRTTYNKEKVLAEMLHDKKAQGGQITVIKVPGLGCWRAETIPVEGLRPLLGMEE